MRQNSLLIILTVTALTACQTQITTMNTNPALTELQPIKHTMRLTPGGQSDVAELSIENIPYVQLEDGAETRYVSVVFDEHEEEPALLHAIHFKTGSANISPREKSTLASRAPTFPKSGIALAGYADSRGAVPYNQTLSENRVKSVARYLSTLGILIDDECAYGESSIPSIQNCGE
ncbi:MAG: OmpA family protein [Neisseria sp.]